MKPALVALAFLGCAGRATDAGSATTTTAISPTDPLADEDRFIPPYGKAQLGRALITERGAEAAAERVVADLAAVETNDDRYRVALADLAVRRRFIAMLEACETTGRWCPPRLDAPTWTWDHGADPQVDPRLETPVRFDLDSWRKVTAELHGRACACRTLSCVESVTEAISYLERRPMPDVQGDEDASRSSMRARECLAWLRDDRAR